MIGQAHDPAAEFAARLRDYERQIGDLARVLSAPTGPRGIIARKTATGSAWTNATATLSDITASTGDAPTITATLDTARLYRAVFHAPVLSSSAGDIFIANLVEGGVARELTSALCGSVAGTGPTAWYESTFIPASSSSVVYKMQGRRSSASAGTVSLVGVSSAQPMVFYIEDLGLA